MFAQSARLCCSDDKTKAAIAGGFLFCFLAVSGEAIAAVNRPIILGHEGHLGGLAALSANCIIHFTGRTPVAAAVITIVFTGITAALAAGGLIGEALLGKKLLIACGEDKFFATVSAS